MLEFIPALHRAVNAIQLLLADERIDVTHAEALVLAQLAEAKVQRMSELRQAFGQRKSTLTSVADRLVGTRPDHSIRRSQGSPRAAGTA